MLRLVVVLKIFLIIISQIKPHNFFHHLGLCGISVHVGGKVRGRHSLVLGLVVGFEPVPLFALLLVFKVVIVVSSEKFASLLFLLLFECRVTCLLQLLVDELLLPLLSPLCLPSLKPSAK